MRRYAKKSSEPIRSNIRLYPDNPERFRRLREKPKPTAAIYEQYGRPLTHGELLTVNAEKHHTAYVVFNIIK